jgi:F0F1-type ATP synthase assembly protein I
MSDSQDQKNWIRSLALFSFIIGDLLVCTGVGVGLGYWAWKHWNAPIWVIMITSMLGLGVAFYRLYLASQAGDQNGNSG